MNNELKEIITETNETTRNKKLKAYANEQNAQRIARNRFIEDIKYIYANCDNSADDNFKNIIGILNFDRALKINGYLTTINSSAMAELINAKENKIVFIGDLINRLKYLERHSKDFTYIELLLFMFVQIATKTDIINLYSAMIAYLDHDKIKDIQEHAILA